MSIIAFGEGAIPLLMALADRGSQLDIPIEHLILLAPVLYFDKENPPLFLQTLADNSMIFSNA